jgi:hypothetical protein
MQENLVGAGVSGLNGQILPTVEDQVVNLAVRRQRSGGFKWRHRRMVQGRRGQGSGQHQDQNRL